ncbi:YsnF/AvaK domain-containing protein [Azospirillum agricola]|uniref:YsnF/AvaK domain-containing protein n=1 Tax=Azospirillum agricola TaxID=1720247 RepID=UPI000A0EF0B0|nr:YsnF/AvaK domain-containing protein [Azospirillum agricola]SMH37916.1 conserved domain-containing protein [Azospirillum lipoferum]
MPGDREEVVPLHTETVSVDKHRIERGRVRVTTKAIEREETVRQALEREDVEIVRVPVNRAVAARPDIRQDGSTTIIPIVEEVLVVERRLILREEIHLRKTTRTVQAEQRVTLRSEDAIVERIEEPGGRDAGSDHPSDQPIED